MSQELKREYLKAIRERYQKSPRVRKSVILEEFVTVCGYSRKYAIRILNGEVEPLEKKHRGRVVKYSGEVVYHLVRLWNAMGRPCSIRFKAALPEWIEFDPDPFLRESASYRALVLGVSRAHLDRLLRPYRTASERGIGATRPGLKSFRNRIPIEPKDWNVKAPGHVQSDTVAHCGDRLEGGFANTLTVTDIHTTWTETRGIWGKGAVRVIDAMREIEKALPFSITSFKSDSGTEFMNFELQILRKTRIGARIKKEYDKPRTPFQRLMECPEIAEERKEELRQVRAGLNPFQLQEGLDRKLRAFQELLRQRNTGRLQAA